MNKSILVTTGMVLALGAGEVSASLVDLTTVNSSGSANGALFYWVDQQSVGTGVFDPFVRLQATGNGNNNPTQNGYNTSGPEMKDVKTGIWTHDILLGAIPVVTISGKRYYEFALDINQNQGGNNELLSLNDIEIFLRSGPLPATDTGDVPTLLNANATKVWDFDIGADGDSTVELNYALNAGSGQGDMKMYVLEEVLGTDLTKNLYLYSSFGIPNGYNDGFEEWGVLGTPTTNVPDGGATVMLLGAAMIGLNLLRRKLS